MARFLPKLNEFYQSWFVFEQTFFFREFEQTVNELVTQKNKTSIVQTHVQLLFPIRRHVQLLFQLDVDYIVAVHIILTILFLFWYYLTFNLIKKKTQ